MFGVSNWLLVASISSGGLVYGLFKLISARRLFKGLPQPPGHSFLWGHIKLFAEIDAKFPSSTHPQHLYTYMSQKYDLPGIFYVDCWPFVQSQMVITDPDAAMQVLTVIPYPKHPTIEQFLRPFTGPHSIAASNGERWKYNHRMVGSAFTPSHVKPMLGTITNQFLVFHNRLRALAETNEDFNMEEETAKAVFDVVGKIVFGFSLEAQNAGSPLLTDLRASIDPATSMTTFMDKLNPWTRRKTQNKLKELKDRVHNTLAKEMRERMAIFQDEKELPSRRQAKSIMDRIVFDRIQSHPGVDFDDTFIETVVTNLKALLLGGHGTTTDTFTWITMFLSLYPSVVSLLRTEHSAIFSPSLETTISLLHSNPNLTNNLPYTNAVIKETLRFFPIGFTIRQAPSTTTSLLWNGTHYPVKDFMVIPCTHTTHMDPKFWHLPKEFRPERFLGEEGEGVERFAWRAFERGPRACIAQDLAMDELRILMLLTVRSFDFETVVEEKLPGSGGGREGVMYMDLDRLVGDLAFQHLGMEARPRHEMRMRVKLAGK